MIRTAGRHTRHAIGEMVKMYGPTRVVYNLGIVPYAKQKRVALVYLSRVHDKVIYNDEKVFHPSIAQHTVMLQQLLALGYIVDVYNCSGDKPYNFPRQATYDAIIGFGPFYMRLCQLSPSAMKILYITENAPWVVREKFAQRMKYHKKLFGHEDFTIRRNDFYTDQMFDISDAGIAMTGSHNIVRMQERLAGIVRIDANALPNPSFDIGKKDFDAARNRFVWFGSRGLIHKGLDILIEAFRELPHYQLTIYGAPASELRGWKLPPNVINRGKIEVMSRQYIDDVVMSHAFTLSLSCSEGMQTGIATCMMSGLIPLVTPETGYDDCPHALHFNGWSCEEVVRRINECASISFTQLRNRSEQVRTYAMEHYTDKAFGHNFNKTVKLLLQDN